MPRTIDIAALLIRQRLMQDIFSKVHLLAKIVAIATEAERKLPTAILWKP